jgi:transglutaminase-like putative cysteine protease
VRKFNRTVSKLALSGLGIIIAWSAANTIAVFDRFPAQTVDDVVDLGTLRQSGEDWQVIDREVGEEGHVRLHSRRWLMYFLHWRPLTDQNRDLTKEYVRNQMLNFWGQAMNFELKNIDGETEVCSHSARFTEGTVMNGNVYTRFIVWNCPETRRQFTADCNINLRLKTPMVLLDLQRLITGTIRCHEGGRPPRPSSPLTQKYESREWNLSFFLPPHWRTAEYPSREWFPNGLTAESGSLWTLLTDSQKHLEVIWREKQGPLSAGLFQDLLKKAAVPFRVENVDVAMVDVRLDSLREKPGVWQGAGTFRLKQTAQGKDYFSDYLFRGLLWDKGGHVYFLLGGVIMVREFWGIPNDLSPDAATFERFWQNQVIPAVKVLPENILHERQTSGQASRSPITRDLALFLKETEHLDFNDPVFTEVMAKTVTPDMPLPQKLEKLFYFTRDAVTFAPSASLKASEALKKGTAICYNKAMIYVSFCRRLGVPAALATEEFIIRTSPKKSLHRHGIAKIYYDGRWHYIDTVSNREAWTYWHKEGAADFQPPAFSLEAHTVVGEDTISGLRFLDAETNDVPKEWLESLSRFQKTGKW